MANREFSVMLIDENENIAAIIFGKSDENGWIFIKNIPFVNRTALENPLVMVRIDGYDIPITTDQRARTRPIALVRKCATIGEISLVTFSVEFYRKSYYLLPFTASSAILKRHKL